MNKGKLTVAEHFPGLTTDDIARHLTQKDLEAEKRVENLAESVFWDSVSDDNAAADDEQRASYTSLQAEYRARQLPRAKACEMLLLNKLLG